MNNELSRREFLVAAPAAAWVMARSAGGRNPGASGSSGLMLLEPFDYTGVRLLGSRWQRQYQSARDTYFGFSNDNILKGFREAAGLPAPGHTLGDGARRTAVPCSDSG